MGKIIKYIYCPKCDKEYQTKSNLNIHLQNKHNFSKDNAKQYCADLNIITEAELKAKKTRLNTNLRKFGVENVFQNNEIKNKSKKTILAKFGVENVSQNKEIKNKIRNTVIKNYGSHIFDSCNIEQLKQMWINSFGVDNPLKSEKIKNKVKKTNLKRYGTEWGLGNKEIQNKIKQTNIEKYGVVRPSCLDEFVEKQKITSFEKYGGRWFTQTDEHHSTNYRFKDYQFPSGRVIQVQGYEPLALDLIITKDNEKNILAESVDIKRVLGEIWYKTKDDKNHRYYPDIYLIKENKIIEVKSVYTYSQQKDINTAKAMRCLELGYSFEFWIFDPKNNLKLEINNIT